MVGLTPGRPLHSLAFLLQRGMFSYTGLTQAQCAHLLHRWHVYLTPDGRISLTGLAGEAAGEAQGLVSPIALAAWPRVLPCNALSLCYALLKLQGRAAATWPRHSRMPYWHAQLERRKPHSGFMVIYVKLFERAHRQSTCDCGQGRKPCRAAVRTGCTQERAAMAAGYGEATVVDILTSACTAERGVQGAQACGGLLPCLLTNPSSRAPLSL